MTRGEFTEQMSKYPKDIILKSIIETFSIDLDRLLSKTKWMDIQCRFDKLMAQSNEISEQMHPLIGKQDFKSLGEFLKLMDKDNLLQKKIDTVMKEMSKSNSEEDE